MAAHMTSRFIPQNKSLRWKIMSCISALLVLVSASLFCFIFLNRISINILSETYNSNAKLNTFQKNITDLEYSMEVYVTYRTYESIDNYYTARVKVEDMRKTMVHSPSTNEIIHREYIVNQLAENFVLLSSRAVSERRANMEKGDSYEKSLECFKILQNEISSLNTLLMENNAGIYMENRKRILALTEISTLFFIVYFLFLLVFLYTMVTRILRPLKDISSVADRVADRDFDIPLFNKTSNDEIGRICRAFDRMIISIREYINTIWEKARTENELREKEMEMQALYSKAQLKAFQSQINPHFLFNTLNTGAQLAMMEGADKTCSFIEQTSDFFRYNLQHKEMTATISEELGMVDSFVYIMKVRFGQRLEFEKIVPENNFPQILPVMTLQPLVENCIKHGLLNTKGKVTLSVTESPEFVTLEISDNGTGMEGEKRKDILMRSKSTDTSSWQTEIAAEKIAVDGEKNTGIGLINVFSRLRLFFQRDDIFDIISGNNEPGTKFILRIPKNV